MVHCLVSVRVQNLRLLRAINTSVPLSKLQSRAFSCKRGGKIPLIQDLEVKESDRLAAFLSLYFREDTPSPKINSWKNETRIAREVMAKKRYFNVDRNWSQVVQSVANSQMTYPASLFVSYLINTQTQKCAWTVDFRWCAVWWLPSLTFFVIFLSHIKRMTV